MEYKLYQYRLAGKYRYDITMNSVYFLTATSMENAERQLREVIHDRNIIYDLRECSFDELPAIFAQLPGKT